MEVVKSKKVDKLEEEYNHLKTIGFNKEELEKEKAEIKNNQETSKEKEGIDKNQDRARLGKINYEISKINEKSSLTLEEKNRLEALKQERKDIKEGLKTSKNDSKENEGIKKNLERKMNLHEGFVKNETKIDRILVYRNKIKEDINEIKKEKSLIDLEIKALGNKEDLTKQQEELENKIEEAKDIDSKISNEEYLKMVNELNDKKEILEKVNKLDEKSKKLGKMIKNKQMAVTKCNLAWKSLFRNQSWDDIHLRAVKIKSNRKENKEKEDENKNNNNKETKQQENNNNDNKETKQNNKENLESKKTKKGLMKRIKDWYFDKEVTENEEEEQALEEYDKFAKKHPRLAKIRDKFKNFFAKSKNKEENRDTSEGRENKKDDRDISEETENKRDAFITELRRIAENDDRQDINKEYIEKHKKIERKTEEKDTGENER